MEGTHRKPGKRASEPVDEWLQNQGFFRKHAPKDPTCLFRAVSEQVYLSQNFHIRVRRECVAFMEENRTLFEEKITIPFESYLEQMACFTEWGGSNEIEAMSKLYKRQITIFDGHTLTKRVINHDFQNPILLCFTSQKQYESIYAQDYITNAAFCQSLVYKMLYKDVFQMPNVDETVHKMLHDRPHSLKHEKFLPKGNMENRDSLTNELTKKMEEGSAESEDKDIHKGGLTPFPYRVAKALDEDIYRNTDFDNWHEIRREVRNSGFSKYNSTEFQVGGRCLVELNIKEEDFTNNNNLCTVSEKILVNDEDDSDGTKYSLTGHIQEMSKNEGPVLVFIVELGEKRTVPYSALKPFTTKRTKSNGVTPHKKNLTVDQSSKFRKSFGPSTRKGKDQATGYNHSSLNFEGNYGKGTPAKKNGDNLLKWADEPSESNKGTFGKQCTENITPEDFTADLDFPEEKDKNATPLKRNDENSEKAIPSNSTHVNGSENNFHLQPQQQNTTYFLPPPENNYQVFPYCMNDMLPNIGYLLDQTAQPINLGAAKSIDANCNDLPIADLQTLRFFYNVGIEYYHAANWLYGSNQPPVINGQYNFGTDNSAGQKPCNVLEDVNQMANVQHKYVFRPKKENGENGIRGHLNQKSFKNSNARFNGIQEPSLQNSIPHKNSKETNKNGQYCNGERNREHVNGSRDVQQRNPRNGIAPRFKKCVDGRIRNFSQPSKRNQQRETEFQQGNNRFPGSKIDGQGKQYERIGGHGNRQNQQPQQVQMPMNNPPYQYASNQPPLYTQSICNEAETYCLQNPGIIPIPYVHQVDFGDNNANPFTPVVYTGIDNYPQTYLPYYPPYTYPPQTVYPGMAPTAAQENWYQYPGHSHYIPPCVQFNPSGTPLNGAM